jgi:tetratricopeptide (TPR) repeat protein
MLERETQERLSKLILDVTLLRTQGTPVEYLTAVRQAALFFPVFPGWESPVDGWLAEAEQLSQKLGHDETLGLLSIRRAVVRMRRGDSEAALHELEQRDERLRTLTPALRAWDVVTRARLLLRLAQRPRARELLEAVVIQPGDDWIAGVLHLAEGELWTEEGDFERAERALEQAWRDLPLELVEERITVLQLRGFAAIARVDAPAALHWLDQARQMVRGAGAWLEVAQMNVATGGFLTSLGDQARAQELLREAVELAAKYEFPELETLARLALTRSLSAAGDTKQAVSAALTVAAAHAKQDNLVGFVAAVVMISRLYAEDANYAEAYRTLATGLAIAKHRDWPAVMSVMRAHIEQLRAELGSERFEAVAQSLLDEQRRSTLH